ncbi:hypothetical protein [Halogeometricum limi]|uniref:Uncharacterized protein n=1 Tax=Halogeometricum limi TaxID=555875 RepID=A0A1I6I540_9EURY|nr:hypothetical protein [Halogeometricum limi]SFR61845.1 hypothetical protein SAMN04488124_2840 [Halogeometricum limi]
MPYVTGLEGSYPEVRLDERDDKLDAVLTYRLRFDDDEKRLNLRYAVFAALYEVDDWLDKYIAWPNGGRFVRFLRVPQRTTDARYKDDFVGWFPTRNTRPEDGDTQDFEVRLRLSNDVRRRLGGSDFELGPNSEVLRAADTREDRLGRNSLNSLKFRAIVEAHPSLSATTFSTELEAELGQIIL